MMDGYSTTVYPCLSGGSAAFGLAVQMLAVRFGSALEAQGKCMHLG